MRMAANITLRDALLPALGAAFPASGMRTEPAPGPVAVFPAACAEVGDVLVYDDGDEATVLIEHVTHHHVNPDDPEMTANERARGISLEVVAFLRALFADRVFLWSRQQGKAGGGWTQPYEGVTPDDTPEDADTFVWSRRVERTTNNR